MGSSHQNVKQMEIFKKLQQKKHPQIVEKVVIVEATQETMILRTLF